ASIPSTARHSSPFSLFLSSAQAPPSIYTLSLHDALPISKGTDMRQAGGPVTGLEQHIAFRRRFAASAGDQLAGFFEWPRTRGLRSEEHTSELQSRSELVCRLLLEKKKRRALHIVQLFKLH